MGGGGVGSCTAGWGERRCCCWRTSPSGREAVASVGTAAVVPSGDKVSSPATSTCCWRLILLPLSIFTSTCSVSLPALESLLPAPVPVPVSDCCCAAAPPPPDVGEVILMALCLS